MMTFRYGTIKQVLTNTGWMHVIMSPGVLQVYDPTVLMLWATASAGVVDVGHSWLSCCRSCQKVFHVASIIEDHTS
jgi:hypothetical protein